MGRLDGIKFSTNMAQTYIRAMKIADNTGCTKVYPIHMVASLTYPSYNGYTYLKLGGSSFEDIIPILEYLIGEDLLGELVSTGKFNSDFYRSPITDSMSDTLKEIVESCPPNDSGQVDCKNFTKILIEKAATEITIISEYLDKTYDDIDDLFEDKDDRSDEERNMGNLLDRLGGSGLGLLMGSMPGDVNGSPIKAMLVGFGAPQGKVKNTGDEEEVDRGKFGSRELGLLNRYGTDICKYVHDGNADPVIGREREVNSMIETLCHKNKSNAMLLGNPGTGKTALVYGLAERIVKGDVPPILKDRHIFSIDMARVKAGTTFRGSLEDRIVDIVDSAVESKSILFFDEFHQFSNSSKSSDDEVNIANIFKPYIACGKLSIIGATTYEEYKKSVESDTALIRRMQIINVEELPLDSMITVARMSKVAYEDFHNMDISNEVSDEIVKLADRYIKNKYFPDKAFTIMDEAASQLRSWSDKEGRIKLTKDAVYSAVSKVAGIDISELTSSEMSKLSKLESSIGKRIIGQEQAVSVVSKAIRRNKVGLSSKTRPVGSFLFVGPTGVGKTELCNVLSTKFGRDTEPVRFDMSEYSEEYSISKLIGAAPGYVGYNSGGQLTEAIKHNPYSVILFDEIEKAHSNIYNILLQMLDNASIKDSNGVRVDCSNCIIILTSNAGYGAETGKKIGFNTDEKTGGETLKLRREKEALKELEKTFKPEILNRLDNIVIFEKLDEDACEKIVNLMLDDVASKLAGRGISIKFNASAIKFISKEGFSDKYGARNLKRTIQTLIENPLADKIINRTIKSGNTVVVSYTAGNIKIDKR